MRTVPELRILIECYEAAPDRGGEAGNGWNLPLHLARAGLDITVLTLAFANN